MARTALILTTFNRPTLVGDAIQSVFGQTTPDWHLYLMDDGSTTECRNAIENALRRLDCDYLHADSIDNHEGCSVARWPRVTWWLGCDRTPFERKRTISYSRSINYALNYLLRDEEYVCYLPDDDYLYPESIKARVDFLDANPSVHVCFARMRSVQFAGEGRFNTWDRSSTPLPGCSFPRPTGQRLLIHDGAAAKTYFHPRDNMTTDPDTGLPYVEEGYWQPGVMQYGQPYRQDHSQVMHRRECLTHCRTWPDGADLGGVQYWGEDMKWGVGDAAAFELLGQAHEFHAVDAWGHVKRFHSLSDGIQVGPVRE